MEDVLYAAASDFSSVLQALCPPPALFKSPLLAAMLDDEVVPFRFWDEQDSVRRLVLEFTYRFDDVLDVTKLKSSLERLLEIGEWRGLGARLKKNVSAFTADFEQSRCLKSTDTE